jgi:hypothetical protein
VPFNSDLVPELVSTMPGWHAAVCGHSARLWGSPPPYRLTSAALGRASLDADYKRPPAGAWSGVVSVVWSGVESKCGVTTVIPQTIVACGRD